MWEERSCVTVISFQLAYESSPGHGHTQGQFLQDAGLHQVAPSPPPAS